MSKIIRIGTRDSELAIWQAKAVQNILKKLGHKSVLVPVKSTGDIVLDKPLYELGITGIFTKTLDIALLNGDIDVAVHSLKDVPTKLPESIVQAAVLKRGNVNDTLVFKDNEEFLGAKNAIIATSSLRRKAQWLNRYPTHTITDIRGNVNSRLEKLNTNTDWNAAIFAAAGLGRIDKRPTDAINLDWMIPAPAQGAIMIATREQHHDILEIFAEINDKETEICTTTERDFLRLLEGGCTAPIGALAKIKDETIELHGVLLSPDGTKKIEVKSSSKIEKHQKLAEYCANFIVEKGGKRLIGNHDFNNANPQVFSTKKLTNNQKDLFENTLKVESEDVIKISINRIKPQHLSAQIENVIITSQNAVEALTTNFTKEELKFKNIYCVGRRTKRKIETKIGKVKHVAKNAKALAEHLVNYIEGTEATYFCSDIRLDNIPQTLEQNNIKLNEIIAYNTKYDSKAIKQPEVIMFYSPSTVKSYLQENDNQGIAFCIGETTALEAKKHFNEVHVSKIPTVESVIECVNQHYKNTSKL